MSEVTRMLILGLIMEIQALTGWPVPDVPLPGLTVVTQVDLAIAAEVGVMPPGKKTRAVYIPKWNVIFVEEKLADDPQELNAVLLHELVHWYQSNRGKVPQYDESEARRIENQWRRKNGVKPRR